MGGGWAALAGGFLVLPGMRLAPGAGRVRLAVRRVRIRQARGQLGAGRHGRGRIPRAARHELGLALPGRANRANAVVALAVAETFGIDAERALPRLRTVASVAGRYTTVPRRGRNVRLLLAKNPAGWLEAFDVLKPAPVPVLLAVNAQGPDGRDTSWLWDVDYRLLRGRPVFAAGERRLDLAVRLEADEVGFQVVQRVDDAVDQVEAGGDLDVIANYTAFQQIRAAFGRAT